MPPLRWTCYKYAVGGMIQTAYLDITTWVGLSPGAEHYYGTLKGPDGENHDVWDSLTAEAARQRNRLENVTHYEAGDETRRFATKTALREAAVAQFKEKYPNKVILVEGSRSTLMPQLVLVGPRPYKHAVNKLYRRIEILYRKTKGDWHPKMDQLCAEWKRLSNEFKITR